MYEVVKSATQKRQLSEKSESPLLNRAHSSYSAARLKRSIIHRQYGETKAQFLWRLLRLFVHKRLDSVTHDELEGLINFVCLLFVLNVYLLSSCLDFSQKQQQQNRHGHNPWHNKTQTFDYWQSCQIALFQLG